MLTSNYNVFEDASGVYFSEAFNATDFNVSFQTDPANDVSPMGWVNFEPRKALAVLVYYGHPEDLMPTIVNFDLYESTNGSEVLHAFAEYKIGELFSAAQAFTVYAVKTYEAEVNRV